MPSVLVRRAHSVAHAMLMLAWMLPVGEGWVHSPYLTRSVHASPARALGDLDDADGRGSRATAAPRAKGAYGRVREVAAGSRRAGRSKVVAVQYDVWPGHVFVVQGDLRRLAADAVLYPTRDFESPSWFPDGAVPGATGVAASEFTEERRVIKLEGTPSTSPQIWLGHLNSQFAPIPQPSTPLSWFLAAAEQFLIAAEEELRTSARPPRNGRARHLLALPVVGTGPKNARGESGDMLTSLLGTLYAFASCASIDVVLVVKSARMFSAAQASRRQLALLDVDLARRQWCDMSRAQLLEARRLARLANSGQLALFLGAGASAGAGLPEWLELLESLAREHLVSDAELLAFRRLSALDQALVIERRLGGPAALQAEVVRRLRTDRHSLVHALLAALPVDGVVTTNYDDLFEIACQGAQAEYNVLPYQAGWHSLDNTARADRATSAGRRSKRWILKLHGCVHHPHDIVLTRTQMNEYADRRQALTGIVQTMLITKHMLFVGFSLRDENFHKVATTVNKALAGFDKSGDELDEFERQEFNATAAAAAPARGAIGTVITLHYRPFLHDLWPQLALVPMDADEGVPIGECARKLEIFLDRVSLLASTTSNHLLDANFDGTFSPQARRARPAPSPSNERPSRERQTRPFALTQPAVCAFPSAQCARRRARLRPAGPRAARGAARLSAEAARQARGAQGECVQARARLARRARRRRARAAVGEPVRRVGQRGRARRRRHEPRRCRQKGPYADRHRRTARNVRRRAASAWQRRVRAVIYAVC